ncbi:hypothetical protein [Enterobacter sp. CP102]|uniref:hypothetical protein n=1 Tax=Enterobacter sp. CP102 TaxID=2976431 RepID=UPI0021FD78F4|nr:hypothetical protein [Enterobacter sp. CP102]UWM66001.1 hypothetical protein N1249_09360 [Enterobacter sp. CP102]
MNHFIHYIRRNLVVSTSKKELNTPTPFYAEEQSGRLGILAPEWHITRATQGAATRIKADDVIWIFAQLYSPWGELPPSLDAKIIVKRVESSTPGNKPVLRFIAKPESRWYPCLDAKEHLKQLRTINSKSEIAALWGNPTTPIGHFLQSMRQLESIDLMKAWEEKIDELPFDFISYRIKDGTHSAWLQMDDLIKQGRAVFWDRWSLPRRMVERLDMLEDTSLISYLYDRIDKCRAVIPVLSPMYGAPGSYSALEINYAREKGKIQQGMGIII